jgi:hypothetical protein
MSSVSMSSAARASRSARQSVQLAEVRDVLARGEMVVDAGAVRQHADRAAGRERIAGDADAVDERVARVGAQDRVQHAQRRRLARAVGPQQAGDLAVAGAEAHAAHGGDGAEGLREIARF